MVELQERDIGYLKLLARFGILNKAVVDRYYGSVENTRKRKRKLAAENYIIKNNSASWLGVKGRRYLESIGIPIRNISGNKYAKERIMKIAEIILQLEDVYKCYPSWETKENLKDMRSLYYAVIENKIDGNRYYIYNTGKFSTDISEKSSNTKN